MKKKETISDFLLAKEIINTLEPHQELFVTATKVVNFRKYLNEQSKRIDKEYVTKIVEGKLRVTRLK